MTSKKNLILPGSCPKPKHQTIMSRAIRAQKYTNFSGKKPFSARVTWFRDNNREKKPKPQQREEGKRKERGGEGSLSPETVIPKTVIAELTNVKSYWDTGVPKSYLRVKTFRGNQGGNQK